MILACIEKSTKNYKTCKNNSKSDANLYKSILATLRLIPINNNIIISDRKLT